MPVAVDPVYERTLRAWPAGNIGTLKHPGEWGYEQGLVLDGMIAEWRATADGRAYSYVFDAINRAVTKDGAIQVGDAPFPAAERSLENVEMGRSVVTMYRTTQDVRYYVAAKFLFDEVRARQPKNTSGGYWHKETDPDQMWIEGSYMAEPFMANFARTFGREADMEEVANQLLLMDTKLRDRKTGLLRHAWDESHKSAWGDKKGLSPEVWARGMGWYAMALVDVLDRMPDSDPQRAAIEDLTRRLMATVVRYQDAETGLWWQVMDKGNRAAFKTTRGDGTVVESPAAVATKGNFPEASASCMFVYALFKGIRMGVVPRALAENAERGWRGIQTTFVKADGTLGGTAQSAGLGGAPSRSGMYEFYVSQPVVDNDAQGVGAYLLADSEVIQHQRAGKLFARVAGKTILFDSWFNAETRKRPDGGEEAFHYKYNDDAPSGYSFFSRMFQQYGMRPEALTHAPRAEDLSRAAVYVIVSPESAASRPGAHLMDAASSNAIAAWVKSGGVLLLMEGASASTDFEHVDTLSDGFGIHFSAASHELPGESGEALVTIPEGTGGIFKVAHTAFEGDVSTTAATSPAMGILTDKGRGLMAVSHAGSGVVFANGSPWLYNEYTDGRNAAQDQDNFAAGQELVRWGVGQIPAEK